MDPLAGPAEPAHPSDSEVSRSRFNISRWALEHAALTRYLMVVLLALGVTAYFQLGQDEDPPFTFRAMVVQASWPGASAQQTDAAVRQLSRISIVEPSEKDVKKLVMRKLSIEPIWSNVDDLIVRNEKIADGALLATTRLIYVPEGAAVEIIEDSAEEVTEEATTVGGAKRPDET